MTVSGLPVVVLFGAVTIGLLALVVIDRLERRPLFVAGTLLVALGLLPTLQGTAGLFGAAGDVAEPVTAPQVLLGQLSFLLVVVAAPLALLRPARVRRGGGLCLALLAFGAATHAAIIAHVGELLPRSRIIWALVALAVYTARSVAPADVARVVKVLLGATIIASAAAGLSGLGIAWRGFEGATPLLPGVDLRLQGIYAHPNSLAPAALLLLMVERLSPSTPGWRRVLLTTGVGCLLLSQSKTTLFAGAVIGALVIYHDRVRPRQHDFRVAPFAAAVVLTVVALLVIGLTDGAEQELLDADQIERTRTLTGRTQLWAAGIDAWREQPVIGAGPEFFVDYARRSNLVWAGQAHNQVVQTLTRYGLLGLGGLMVYVVGLGVYAWRHRDRSQFMSVALVSLLLMRSLTETPLDRLDMLPLLTVMLLIGWSRESAVEPHPVAGEAQPAGSDVDSGP